MNFSDQDILTDLLLDSKMISTGYHHALLEAAGERSRGVIMQIHNDELNTHRQIFELMYARGLYQVEPAQAAISGTYASTMGMNMPGQQAVMQPQQLSPGMVTQSYYNMPAQSMSGMPNTYNNPGR
jgi:spore coat protein CotF